MHFKEKRGLAGIFKRSSSIDNLFDEVSVHKDYHIDIFPKAFIVLFHMNSQCYSIGNVWSKYLESADLCQDGHLPIFLMVFLMKSSENVDNGPRNSSFSSLC